MSGAGTKYERITCEEVREGDRIARARTHQFLVVTSIGEGPVSRILNQRYPDDAPARENIFTGLTYTIAGKEAETIRPRRTAKLWRLVDE